MLQEHAASDNQCVERQSERPVVFDAGAGGYKYARTGTGDSYELPGLWFLPVELHALAIMRSLLKDTGPFRAGDINAARSSQLACA
jgi:predicted DNA-binding transcriptional regulator YafY